MHLEVGTPIRIDGLGTVGGSAYRGDTVGARLRYVREWGDGVLVKGERVECPIEK